MKFLYVSLLLISCISYSQSISNSYLKVIKQKAVEIIDHVGPKDECSRHMKVLVADLFNLKKIWAMQMLDASAKLQTGYLAGNMFHFGSFDQCLRIREDKGEAGVIEGQYCTVVLTSAKNATNDLGRILDLTTAVPDIFGIPEGRDMKHILKYLKVIYGICLPKSCSADRIQKLWNYMEYTFRWPFHVTFVQDFCTYKGKVPQVFEFDNVVIWGFILYFVFLCLASIYEIMFIGTSTGTSHWNDILISFSLRKNALKIFDTRPSPDEDPRFKCITGLKVICMLWVIYGHKTVINFLSGSMNMMDYFEWRKLKSALIVVVAPFAVDVFLAISGILLAYKYMQIRDLLPRNIPFPYFMFYFGRFLRLWPCLVATILIYANVIKYLNNGPLWPLITYKISLSCRYAAWPTALFITNLVSFHNQCLEPAWYLAVDTQLYCIAPLLLYPLYKYPKRTTLGFIILVLASSAYAYYITLTTRGQWATFEGDDTYHERIYQSPFVRMPTWIFGLLTGAFLYKVQRVQIPSFMVNLMWISIAALFSSVTIATNIFLNQSYNEYNAATYNALARPSWGIAVCMLIFLCATGYGGFVNDILSLDIYKPLAKISYSVYLLHSAVMFIIQGGKRSSIYFDGFTTFQGYLGDMPFILITSTIWCLAFESPFINITKIILKQAQIDVGKKNAIEAADEKRLTKTTPESRKLTRDDEKSKKAN